MGTGGFREAALPLVADIPAGTYHVECDAIIITSVDTTFDLIWRRGATDTTLATWSKHWEPLPGGVYDAQAYELDLDVTTRIDFREGDEFVFRYTGENADRSMAFIPNGDGARAHGRIPNITFPKSK
ncbi:MAG: hypothetical protein KF773_40175 [Deltaproteobacteria bacterium]|nr:hypothetical protein [Deltaproteobacteria bacterium]MCW5804351.1 hypothetical protein [Deltaproteobacteria bacterium]